MKPRRMPPLLAAAAVCGGAASAAVLRGGGARTRPPREGRRRDGRRERRRRALEGDAAAAPAPPCVACDDQATGWQIANGFDCATDEVRLKKKCNKDGKWTKEGFCRLSCYNAGLGYPGDVCCGPAEQPAPDGDGDGDLGQNLEALPLDATPDGDEDGDGDEDEDEDPYWWHENVSDEKDIVYYQDLGARGGMQALSAGDGDGGGGGGGPQNALGDGEVAFLPQEKVEPNLESHSWLDLVGFSGAGEDDAGGDDGGDDGGRGGFQVFAISVSNEPDTSGLPHNQAPPPTQEPTPQPTREPTPGPTDAPATPSPVEAGPQTMEDSFANGDNDGEEGADHGGDGEQEEREVKHYPMWSTDFQGCVSSSDPPDVYVNMMVTNVDGDKTPYLFDNVRDCCEAWFNNIYEDCVGDEEWVTDEAHHMTESGNHYVEVTWDQNSAADGSGADDLDGEEPEPQSEAHTDDLDDPSDPGDPDDYDPHAEDPDDYNLHDKDPGGDGLAQHGSSWFLPTPLPSPEPSPGPSPSPVTPAPTPYPTPQPVYEIENYHAAAYHAASASTGVLYEDSFEDGAIDYASPAEDYFTWSRRGNGQWSVLPVDEGQSFDGRTHVAAIAGAGEFAIESNLILTVGGRDDDDAEDLREVMRRGGAFVTFGVKTSVKFPIDSFVFKVDEKILGYWTDPSDGWERVTAYISPSEGHGSHKHQLKWTYYYYGTGEDVEEDRVQLDTLTVEATTGDLLVDDQKLQHLEYGTVPALDLSHPPGRGAWEVAEDPEAYEGYLVLRADTREVVRAADALDTYHAAATMSLIIVPGEWGGVLRFALRSNLQAPMDVLEVGVDGEAVLAATETSDGWEEHTIELQPGRRVVTFAHISNPAMLPVETVEAMGRPGWSEVDNLHYVDHIDPRLLTAAPTEAPTPGPTDAPTPFSIPVQNYCAGKFDDIRDTCYTENPRTCNDGDEPCPPYTFCYGNVECEIPEVAHRWWEETPAPSPPPTPAPVSTTVAQNYCGESLGMIKEQCASGRLDTCNNGATCPLGFACWGNVECEVQSAQAPQNYCGTSLAMIKEQCASGRLDTCNDGDEPCKSGTYCWGNVQCERAVTEPPVPSPAEEQTIESFLDSFLGIYAGSTSDSTSEDQEEEQADVAQQDTPQQDTSPPWQQADCPAGTLPVEGLPECCVADPSFLGDGACDAHPPYNTEACGFDLGDCCRDSCNPDSPFKCAAKDGDQYGPFGYFCIDPRYGPAVDAERCQVEHREWVGDGGCDAEYNVEECGWDGGDCCRQSCDPTFAYYECGSAQPFECKDPNILYRADYVP